MQCERQPLGSERQFGEAAGYTGDLSSGPVSAAPETYLLGKSLHFLISQMWTGLRSFTVDLVVL